MAKRRSFSRFAFSLAAMLVPAGMQLALFAFFARTLGPYEYGLYIALLSWAPICFEIVGWGAGEHLIKRTAQDRLNLPIAQSHLTAATLLSLPLGLLVFVLLTTNAMGESLSLWTIALIGLGEFLGLRLLVNAEQTSLALQRFTPANWLRSMQVAPRIAGIMIAHFALGYQTFEAFAIAGSLSMLVAGVAAALLTRIAKRPALCTEAIRQGSWFMGTQLVRASQQNIDRVVLSSLVDPAILAFYSAAQRIVQIGMIPLQAILRLSYPRFFKAGASGISASARYGLSLLPAVLGATILTTLALMILAPSLPLLIGAEFQPSVDLLCNLAPLLPLFALNSTMADALSGAGYLSLRLALTIIGVAAQALMFALFHEGQQIVWASYCGLGINCILLFAALAVLTTREWKATQLSAVAP